LPSAAVVGTGTFIKIGNGLNGASVSWTTIAEVKDIDGPALARTIIDATSHDSAGRKEKKPGVKDAGSVSFEMNFLPQNATQSFTSGLLFDFKNDSLRDFQLIFNDPATTIFQFVGIVKDFAPKAPVDGVLTAKITLELTGTPIFH